MNGSVEPDGAFPRTQWTVVLSAGAGGDDEQSGAALELLCRRYWQPLYIFARRDGLTEHEAEDAVQGFLARILARRDLAKVRPEKGKFRSWLLTAMRNFLTSEARRAGAVKRGGGVMLVDLDADGAGSVRNEVIHGDLSPEEAFDRRWAELVLSRSLERLQCDYERRSKGPLFLALRGTLTGDITETYADLGSSLGLSEGAMAVAVHRLRHRFSEVVREEILETVGTASDLDSEMRHLYEVLVR